MSKKYPNSFVVASLKRRNAFPTSLAASRPHKTCCLNCYESVLLVGPKLTIVPEGSPSYSASYLWYLDTCYDSFELLEFMRPGVKE